MRAISFQKYVAGLAVVLFLAKITAWYFTNSVMVLTDALEGIVNVVSGFLGLYCINFSTKPRDINHPYGHTKVEYLSSTVEGTLIIISGFVIIYEATVLLIKPHQLQKLDVGLVVIVLCGLVNYVLGKYAVIAGRKHNSVVLESAGNHLITDGYSSIAVIIGLTLLIVLQYFSITKNKYLWIDSAVALGFAIIIIYTGYKVLRKSIAGIMDEVDEALLKSVVKILQDNRKPQWIDLHNMRVIQYGNTMHIDAHISLPRFYNISEAEIEIEAIKELIKSNFENHVELFFHIDSCVDFQCKLCTVNNCRIRTNKFGNEIKWNVHNLLLDEKHGINS